MSATPMRSVIRFLADSPLVEKIALDHENNNVKIYYKSEHKNAESVRDIVDVVNYYFEKRFDAEQALVLIGKKEKEKVILKSRKDYHLNTYSSLMFDVYRIDIHDNYAKDDKYYNPEEDIIEVELTCLEYAKDFIFAELRKKTTVKKCVVEFNYMNIKDSVKRDRYLGPIKQLPKTISKNIGISLVRITPDDDLDAINATLETVKGIGGDCCLSVYYHDNLPLIERALSSQADKIYLTVDFKGVDDESDIEALHHLVKEHPKSRDIYVIQYNTDKDNAKMIGETSNTLKYTGRQVIKRG